MTWAWQPTIDFCFGFGLMAVDNMVSSVFFCPVNISLLHEKMHTYCKHIYAFSHSAVITLEDSTLVPIEVEG